MIEKAPLFMSSRPRPRGKLDRDLIDLQDNILRLSLMVDRALERSLIALKEHNEVLARHIIPEDKHINALRYDVEKRCYTILATQQPTAGDMRAVITATHLATDLERIADHAAGIAKITVSLSQYSLLKPSNDLMKMGEITREMLKASTEAYLKGDCEIAKTTIQRDDEVDRLNKQVYATMLDLMLSDSSTINRATFLLWISHNLERAADHVTNICERVIFMVTGEITGEIEG